MTKTLANLPLKGKAAKKNYRISELGGKGRKNGRRVKMTTIKKVHDNHSQRPDLH